VPVDSKEEELEPEMEIYGKEYGEEGEKRRMWRSSGGRQGRGGGQHDQEPLIYEWFDLYILW